MTIIINLPAEPS